MYYLEVIGTKYHTLFFARCFMRTFKGLLFYSFNYFLSKNHIFYRSLQPIFHQLPTMKITALFLMLLGVLFITGLGFASLLLFATSFDAPGSIGMLGVWAIHFLILLSLLAFVAVLVFAGKAYRAGNYARSAGFGSVFGVAVLGLAIFFGKTSHDTLQAYRATEAQATEDARLYPVQYFIRPVPGGADTIIVFPGRIVAYRLHVEGNFPFAGPVGDLNAARDTIVVSDREFVARITREELARFADGQGHKLTDVFAIRWEASFPQKSE